MLPVRLRPEALAELTAAWWWYEDQRGGLGDEFQTCVDAAIAEIARSPLAWQQIHGETRRRFVRRFPYSIIYVAEFDHIEVLAVFHSSRDPEIWRSRG